MKLRLAAALGFAVAGLAASAFAASNTVPATKAGDGAGAISGYVVTNVKYTVNGTNPRNVDSVKFDLDSAPPTGATVKMKLVSGGTTYYDCTWLTSSPFTATCATTSPQADVFSADELRVIIVP